MSRVAEAKRKKKKQTKRSPPAPAVSAVQLAPVPFHTASAAEWAARAAASRRFSAWPPLPGVAPGRKVRLRSCREAASLYSFLQDAVPCLSTTFSTLSSEVAALRQLLRTPPGPRMLRRRAWNQFMARHCPTGSSTPVAMAILVLALTETR